MPSLKTKTFIQLIGEIKREAKVDGSNNLDTFIKELINGLLLEYVKTNYQELLVLNQTFTLIAATGNYALPANFRVLRDVRYRIGANGVFRPLYYRPQYVRVSYRTFPRYYDIAAGIITLSPFEQIKTDDAISYDYYKYPDELVADADVFPIPKLIVPLKRAAVSRVYLYNRDLQVASAFGAGIPADTPSRHTDTPESG